MTEQETIFFEKANEIAVNIMFCAASEELVSIKNVENKYFYTIFCLELLNSHSYVIFSKIFKPTKRKRKCGMYFNLSANSTQLLETVSDANTYLKNFIMSFDEHDRKICNFNSNIDNIPAGEAILLINEWEKSIFRHYNQVIPTINKQNKTSSV